MSEIPTAFGGFAPFPNTIMIPTMGLQSDVIGFRFGFGYEKGKRTLRAMSNEQFNNLDEASEQAIYKHHEATAINFFKLEIQNWTNLQKIIIEKSVEIEKMKANRTPSAFREIFEGFTDGFGTQQKQDAKNFFTSMNNTIMNLIGYFSGGTKTTTSPLPPSILPPERPTTIDQVKPTPKPKNIKVELTETFSSPSTPKPETEDMLKLYTISYKDHLSHGVHPFTRNLKNWIITLKDARANVVLYESNPSLSKFYQNIVLAVSNGLKLQTGKWY